MHAGMQAQLLTCVQLFVTPWTAAHQAPLSMGFSRLEYRSGLPFPPPGDLPSPGIELESPEPPALACRFFTTEPRAAWEAYIRTVKSLCCTPKTNTKL